MTTQNIGTGGAVTTAAAAGDEDTVGTDGLLSGWALVAAWLRARLIEHAESVGCDCGSEDWLRRLQLDKARGGERGNRWGRGPSV